MKPKNTICLWFDKDAHEAARIGWAILDEAQREPIVIRRQDRDIGVVLSMADYERLRSGNIQPSWIQESSCGGSTREWPHRGTLERAARRR